MNPPAAGAHPARLATDLAKPLPLSDSARSLLSPHQTVRQYFDILSAQPSLAEDALRFLAAALPKREAVRWAAACVKSVLQKPTAEAAKAISCVEAWVAEPSEANRRACEGAAAAAGHDTAAGCLADAAFWSGGSLSAPHLPPAPPRDDLTGIAATAALLLAAALKPESAAETRMRFVWMGAEIAGGKKA